MNKLTWLSGVALAALLCADAPDTSAMTVSGMSGHGWPNPFDTCFGSSWTMMVNNCSGTVGSTRLLILPMPVSVSGTHYYNGVRAGGNGSNGITTCQGLSIWGDGSLADWTDRVSTNTSTASQYLSLIDLWVPYGGTAHFECDVAQGGGRVYTAELG